MECIPSVNLLYCLYDSDHYTMPLNCSRAVAISILRWIVEFCFEANKYAAIRNVFLCFTRLYCLEYAAFIAKGSIKSWNEIYKFSQTKVMRRNINWSYAPNTLFTMYPGVAYKKRPNRTVNMMITMILRIRNL